VSTLSGFAGRRCLRFVEIGIGLFEFADGHQRASFCGGAPRSVSCTWVVNAGSVREGRGECLAAASAEHGERVLVEGGAEARS